MCVRSQFGEIFRLYGDPKRDRGQQSHLAQSYNGFQILISRKVVQQLTSRLVALGWFISRFTNRLKPFFITLRGVKRSSWNEECDQAFMAIKQYLTKPPILASPKADDTLYLYLAVLEVSISVALFKEDENRK